MLKSPEGLDIQRRPHYHVSLHAEASWINQVERWFAEAHQKAPPERCSYLVRQLEADVRSFIDGTTKIPGPSNGPNLPAKSWLQLNASATKRSRHYVPNFKFT